MIDKNASAALKVLLHPVPRPMWLRAWRLDEERWGWLAWAGLAAELIDVMLVLNAKQRTRLAACRPGAGATAGPHPGQSAGRVRGRWAEEWAASRSAVCVGVIHVDQ